MNRIIGRNRRFAGVMLGMAFVTMVVSAPADGSQCFAYPKAPIRSC